MTQAIRPRTNRRRGEPLLVLGGLLLGWIALRAALWEQITLPSLPVAATAPTGVKAVPLRPVAVIAAPAPAPMPALAPAPASVRFATSPFAPALAVPTPAAVAAPAPGPTPVPDVMPAPVARSAARVAAGHQLAWMAGVAQLPMPQFVMARPTGEAQPVPKAAGRWSADGWLLLRRGGGEPAFAGVAAPSYGRSQLGAVLRYRLAPANPHRPAAYLRFTSATETPRDEELALGFAVRPLAKVPLALVAEGRVLQRAGDHQLRPALAVVSELPRLPLPLGLSAEVYAQAGVVGGAAGTPFIDGQIRVERTAATSGSNELRAGLAAWGGAQKGANRIDFGPSATLDFQVGPGRGRLSADWRLRIAGNASPRSGPAITLSAGF